jgi:hypothetical protein
MKSTALMLPALVLALLFGLAPQVQAQSGIVSYQEGVNGYVGTLDTQLRMASSNANTAASADIITDAQDGNPAGATTNYAAQIILRFDNIIGPGPGQIPQIPGLLIRKADLILYSTADNAQSGGTIGLHRILQDWVETCNWATCFGTDGVHTNDIEAVSTNDAQFVPNFGNPTTVGRQSRTNDVRASIQAWVDGAPNYGWVLVNPSTDGYRMNTSENGTVANRPLLLVEYGQCVGASITQDPTAATVEQCRTATFSAQAVGSAPVSFQWNKDGVGLDTFANPSAATATLIVTNVQSSDAGAYSLTVSNECGIATSADATLTVNPDVTPPAILSAVFDAYNVNRLVVTFSEPMTDLAVDQYTWAIEEIPPPGEQASTIGITTGTFIRNERDQVEFIFEPARDTTLPHRITLLSSELADRCTGGNPMTFGDFADIVNPGLGFRNQIGGNNYVGTQDTEIHEDDPGVAGDEQNTPGGTSGGPDAATVTVDNEDSTPDGARARALLRFDDIFGSGAAQIPFGATINSATLIIRTDDPSAGTMRLYKMLVDWNEATTTWNTLNGGIDDGTNDVEATFLTTFDVAGDEEADSIDITAQVQDWARGVPNYGFAFIPSSATDGWDFDTSESGTETQRPSLLVTFTVPRDPCSILQQPQPVTVNEGQPFSISVGASGAGLTYQWYKGGVAIQDATNATYRVAVARPLQHGGSYHVVVNGTVGPSTCPSDPAQVTVVPDTGDPKVGSAIGNRDQTTITITFEDASPLNAADAQNTANYTVGGGVTVNLATLDASGKVVTLETSPRAKGVNYSLEIKDIRDTAETPNMLDPNPTRIATLRQEVLLLAADATWKYRNDGPNLDGSGWETSGYVDTAWPSAQILMGLEPSGGPRQQLFAQGWNTNNLFLLSRTNTVGGGLNGTNIVDYFRATVNLPFSLADTIIQVRHVTDDGAVVYFNGTEAFRYLIAAGPVGYLTEATGTAPEGLTRTNFVTSGLINGDNTIAVSVHQGGTPAHNSSDVVFGLELLAIYGATPPTLSIVRNPDGTLTLSWNPTGGTLQQSTDLTNWVPAASQANPQTITPAGLLFYRVAP